MGWRVLTFVDILSSSLPLPISPIAASNAMHAQEEDGRRAREDAAVVAATTAAKQVAALLAAEKRGRAAGREEIVRPSRCCRKIKRFCLVWLFFKPCECLSDHVIRWIWIQLKPKNRLGKGMVSF